MEIAVTRRPQCTTKSSLEEPARCPAQEKNQSGTESNGSWCRNRSAKEGLWYGESSADVEWKPSGIDGLSGAVRLGMTWSVARLALLVGAMPPVGTFPLPEGMPKSNAPWSVKGLPAGGVGPASGTPGLADAGLPPVEAPRPPSTEPLAPAAPPGFGLRLGASGWADMRK